jgi:hypothetical protein
MLSIHLSPCAMNSQWAIIPLQSKKHTSMVLKCEHIFSPFLEPPVPLKRAWFLHSIFTIKADFSLALLPIFTDSLMSIRCSRFSTPLFPPTVYHEHVLLPMLLRKERLIWSVAHTNTSWNMSKEVWVHESAWLKKPETRCGHSWN